MCLSNEGEDATCDGRPLDGKGGHQQVETHTAVAIATEEGHEKTEPNKYHDMDILKDWRGEGGERGYDKVG